LYRVEQILLEKRKNWKTPTINKQIPSIIEIFVGNVLEMEIGKNGKNRKCYN